MGRCGEEWSSVRGSSITWRLVGVKVGAADARRQLLKSNALFRACMAQNRVNMGVGMVWAAATRDAVGLAPAQGEGTLGTQRR